MMIQSQTSPRSFSWWLNCLSIMFQKSVTWEEYEADLSSIQGPSSFWGLSTCIDSNRKSLCTLLIYLSCTYVTICSLFRLNILRQLLLKSLNSQFLNETLKKRFFPKNYFMMKCTEYLQFIHLHWSVQYAVILSLPSTNRTLMSSMPGNSLYY